MRLDMSDKWRTFWNRVMSAQTARFILALLALGFAAYGGYHLMTSVESGEAAVFAVGQLFALASMAFGYYFGSTARGDEKKSELEDAP
jgi:hypothetical protein